MRELKLPRTEEAKRFARFAHEEYFERRQVCCRGDDTGFICLADNRPSAVRDSETRRLTIWLADRGHQIVGAHSYPTQGASAGHTLGMVIQYRRGLTFQAAFAEIYDARNAAGPSLLAEPPLPTAWARVSDPAF